MTIAGLNNHNGFNPLMSGLHIYAAHMVTLANTALRYNTYYWPMLTLERIRGVIIEGHCIIEKNTVLLGEEIKISR